MILFSDYQTVIVQPNMMGKRNGGAVEYCRHVDATAHKLVNKRAQWKFSGDKHKSLQVDTERTFHQRYPLAML